MVFIYKTVYPNVGHNAHLLVNWYVTWHLNSFTFNKITITWIVKIQLMKKIMSAHYNGWV